MDQMTCLITGATSGIGKAAALALAKKDFRLVLIGRNKEKTARVCEEIKRKSHNEKVDCYVCDLSVLSDVRSLAGRIKEDHHRIDILINNAGARFLRHQLTKEGIEMTSGHESPGSFRSHPFLDRCVKKLRKCENYQCFIGGAFLGHRCYRKYFISGGLRRQETIFEL